MASDTARIARAVIQERKRIATWLLRQRVKRPYGEAEEHVNDVLTRLAEDVREGVHFRD